MDAPPIYLADYLTRQIQRHPERVQGMSFRMDSGIGSLVVDHGVVTFTTKPVLHTSFSRLAKARFATCKACSDSREDGFKCNFFPGCCFGRHRTTPTSHCPIGKW